MKRSTTEGAFRLEYFSLPIEKQLTRVNSKSKTARCVEIAVIQYGLSLPVNKIVLNSLSKSVTENVDAPGFLLLLRLLFNEKKKRTLRNFARVNEYVCYFTGERATEEKYLKQLGKKKDIIKINH